MAFFNSLINRQHDQIMTKEIQNMSGKIAARSDLSELRIAKNELNEFRFLEFKVLSKLNIKTYDGGVAVFKSDKRELSLESDTMEITTEFSRSLNLGITTFEVDLEDGLQSMIETETLQSIEFRFGKKRVGFDKIDQEHFLEVLLKEEDLEESEDSETSEETEDALDAKEEAIVPETSNETRDSEDSQDVKDESAK